MMVSTKGRYALRIMLELARARDGAPVSLRQIARQEEISAKYLESIAAQLLKAGLVTSTRGKDGGYRLTRAPEECSVEEILRLTEGTMAPVACVEPGGGCGRASHCLTYPMWKQLDQLIEDYLRRVSLADLLEGRLPALGCGE